ncbi:MAG: glycosyltransferase [Acidobacteria bacterium]|nr:glycosyltransferase [Acidobacteriota bacterium]
MPMHLGFLTNGYAGIGQYESGAGNYLTRLAPLLVRRGHECEVFCNTEGLPIHYEVIEHIEGVKVHVLPDDDSRLAAFSRLPSPTPVGSLASSWRVAHKASQVHQRHPFDAIQVTNYQFGALFLDVDAPIVMRMSSYSPLWRKAEVHMAADESFPLEWYVEFMLERNAIAASDIYYAPSRFLCDRYREYLDLDVRLIRPPACLDVHSDEWDREWCRTVTAGASPYLAFVNAINRRKGGHILAAALPRFFDRCPNVHIHLIGQPLDCLELLLGSAGQHRDRVHYHGTVAHKRVYPLLASAMGLVFPSLIDNLPNTVIEAMMLGVPAIVARNCSADELIADGRAGFLVPSASPDALADAMIRLVHMPTETRRMMGEQGKDFVERLLEPEAAADSLEALFAEVRGMPRRRRLSPEQRLRLVAAAVNDLCAVGAAAARAKAPRAAFAPLVAALIKNGVRSIVIYGAGEAGQTLAREMRLFGIEVPVFVDSNPALWGRHVLGIRVVPLSEAVSHAEPVFAVGSLAWTDQIVAQIESAYESSQVRPGIYRPRTLTHETGSDDLSEP